MTKLPEDRWEDAVSDIAPRIYIPPYIEDDITCSQVQAIVQGGCASGAYMPAVTYWQARKTMAEYGDQIFQDLEDLCYVCHELVSQDKCATWDGWACVLISVAVEAWANGAIDEIEEEVNREDDDDDEEA